MKLWIQANLATGSATSSCSCYYHALAVIIIDFDTCEDEDVATIEDVDTVDTWERSIYLFYFKINKRRNDLKRKAAKINKRRNDLKRKAAKINKRRDAN